METQRIAVRGPIASAYPIQAFFYDGTELDECFAGHLHVERLYWFDMAGEEDWDELWTIYEGLPGWQGHRLEELPEPDRLPYWFGIDDDAPPVLSASAEMGGVQIWGHVLPEQLKSWEDEFHARIRASNLPLYTYRNV